MTALENVMAGEHVRLRATLIDGLLHTPRHRAEERVARERARELLRFVGLERSAERYARDLPYGSQRRLEIARALASGPAAAAARRAGGGDEPAREEATSAR